MTSLFDKPSCKWCSAFTFSFIVFFEYLYFNWFLIIIVVRFKIDQTVATFLMVFITMFFVTIIYTGIWIVCKQVWRLCIDVRIWREQNFNLKFCMLQATIVIYKRETVEKVDNVLSFRRLTFTLFHRGIALHFGFACKTDFFVIDISSFSLGWTIPGLPAFLI